MFCVDPFTIKILGIGTGRSEQTVQTQMRLLIKEHLMRVYSVCHCILCLMDALLHYCITVKPKFHLSKIIVIIFSAPDK